MQITLYSTHCPKCQTLENKLKSYGFSYELNTDVDLMLLKGIKSAPALEVDGKILSYKEAIKFINSQGANE
jgi:hypothetical protein